MAAPAPTPAAPQILRGICKQVLSGDTIVIRGQPKGGPPPEKTVSISKINAPKLARPARSGMEETLDEPFAWEAREYLRRKVVGQLVCFVFDYQVPTSGREFGTIYLGKDPETGENVAEEMLSEGLVSVRREGLRGEEGQRYMELEDAAKTAFKGRWGPEASSHVRILKNTIESPRAFVDKMGGQHLDAVVEYVRDGSTMRLLLLPEFYQVTFMLSGVKAPLFKPGEDGVQVPVEPLAEQAKFFTEVRLLQRDVQVVLESINNNNFVGSVFHPNGDIAELLLKEGFARCVDWSMSLVTRGPERLRAAEREAKEKRMRIWQNYTPSATQLSGKEKAFNARVVEVLNADSLNVIPDGSTDTMKVFLSSIRPPKLPEGDEGLIERRGKTFRPLYDIPFMFDAREFLRKKLVGKKVSIAVDYVQPSANNLPERTCATVKIGDVNVAEALVAKGLASVVRYRQDDDHRSAHYDELLAAEMKAQKSAKGLHSAKENATTRIADLSGDLNKSKQFLPFLQRAGKTEAIVEFVASGSRIRVFIKRETCLTTLLLGGISCPRASRTQPMPQPGEPWGDEAMAFTKSLCLQREVEVEVEAMDRVGNFIGWAFVEGRNISVLLVEEGLATVHFSADRSQYKGALQGAEDRAKAAKKGLWKDYNPAAEDEHALDGEGRDGAGDRGSEERKTDYQKVVITEVTPELRFYAQSVERGSELVGLMEQIRSEFQTNPPMTGAYTPTRGEICAAKFDEDGQWYRARVEKLLQGSRAQVFYMDYGNREAVSVSSLATLPGAFQSPPAYAAEYGVALAKLPLDPEFRSSALKAFVEDTSRGEMLINVEYRVEKTPFVTILAADGKEDIIKALIGDGFLLVENRREKRFQTLLQEYKAAEQKARKNHLNLWQYGDITEDDAVEFGFKPARTAA